MKMIDAQRIYNDEKLFKVLFQYYLEDLCSPPAYDVIVGSTD